MEGEGEDGDEEVLEEGGEEVLLLVVRGHTGSGNITHWKEDTGIN